MEQNEIISNLTEAVVTGNKDDATAYAEKALELGIDPYVAVIDGLAKGMEIMGVKYDNKEAYMPQLMMASNAMYGGMNILTPHLKKEDGEKSAVAIIGSVEGDVHDIGKNLVKTMLTANGFEAIDLGKDVEINDFADAAVEHQADIISLSTLMTSTMDNMEATIKHIQDQGIRDKVKILIGGAPVTQAFADEVGADGTATDAMEAARLAKELLVDLSDNRWN
jgi:corrinoid protein of di/trimethylamine methyltransferase